MIENLTKFWAGNFKQRERYSLFRKEQLQNTSSEELEQFRLYMQQVMTEIWKGRSQEERETISTKQKETWAKRIEEMTDEEYMELSALRALNSEEVWAQRTSKESEAIFHAILSSAFGYYYYDFNNGRIVKIQGYEWMELNWMQNIEEIDPSRLLVGKEVIVIEYMFKGRKHQYHADIQLSLPSMELREVKSIFTFNCNRKRNITKFQTVIDQGYKMILAIWNHKEECEYRIIMNPGDVVDELCKDILITCVDKDE